jgi:hypothetical protein
MNCRQLGDDCHHLTVKNIRSGKVARQLVQKAPSAGNKRRCSAASWRALAFRLYPKVDRLIPSASHGRCAGLRGPTIKNHGRLAS